MTREERVALTVVLGALVASANLQEDHEKIVVKAMELVTKECTLDELLNTIKEWDNPSAVDLLTALENIR